MLPIFLVILVAWLLLVCRSFHSSLHCLSFIQVSYCTYYLFLYFILFTHHYTKENSMYLETYLAINLIPILLKYLKTMFFFYYWKTSIVPKGTPQEMPWKILPLWGQLVFDLQQSFPTTFGCISLKLCININAKKINSGDPLIFHLVLPGKSWHIW